MPHLIQKTIALVLLVLLSPLLLLALIIITSITLKNPFFRQSRIGLNEKKFTLYKLKTMQQIYDKNGFLVPDNQRFTFFGIFLRKTSIDELPQLWHVLTGEMNLVGPRPLLPEYLPLYNEKQRRRHHVRPGITGWAQINGRNRLPWKARLEMDTWYVQNRTWQLDLQILWLTALKVFHKNDGEILSEKFNGNT